MRSLLLTLLLAVSPLSAVDREIHGQRIEDLTFKGSLDLHRSESEGLLQVLGTLNASDSTLDEVEVKGTLLLKNCIVTGEVAILGTFIAERSRFDEPIFAFTKEMEFNCSRVDSIHINKVGHTPLTQIVKLKNGTVVEGNITFESKNGEIWLYKESRFLGAVVGGKIVPIKE